MSRTVIEFVPTADPWPVIDAWAAKHRFALEAHGNWGRGYKRGDGFFVNESRVLIEPTATGLRISGWAIFWIGGSEQSLDNVDFIAYFPRIQARKIVNDLLAQLGAPLIRK